MDEASGMQLVAIARRSLDAYVRSHERYEPDLAALPAHLAEPGSSFVTLVTGGELRGCIGSVAARQPLAHDVAHNAVAAATADPRFMPVGPDELDRIRLEVTVLSAPEVIAYRSYDELVGRIRPGVDGVMLTRLGARGLLLPQVWARVPDPHVFLEHVCMKAGLPPAELHEVPPTITAWAFAVEHFHELGYVDPA